MGVAALLGALSRVSSVDRLQGRPSAKTRDQADAAGPRSSPLPSSLWLVLRPLFNVATLAESPSLVAAITAQSRGSSDDIGKTRTLRGVGKDVQEASTQRTPPLVTIWLSAESINFLSEALTVEARERIKSGGLVCEEPLRLQIKTMVHTSTLLEGRWDIASGEVEAVYADLQDEWEYCVTGRWPWDEDED